MSKRKLLLLLPGVTVDPIKLALTFIYLTVQWWLGYGMMQWSSCAGRERDTWAATGGMWPWLNAVALGVLALISIWWTSWFFLYLVRLCTVELVKGRRMALRMAARYAWDHFGALWHPVAALVAAILALWWLASLIRMVAQVPYFGEVLASLSLMVIWVLLFLALTLALGLAGGFPLMAAAIAIEGRGSFDALVRGYGYFYRGLGLWLLWWGRILIRFLPILLLVLGGGLLLWWATYSVWGGGWWDLSQAGACWRMMLSDSRGAGVVVQAALNLGYAGLLLSYPLLVVLVSVPVIYLILRNEFEGVALDRIRLDPQERRHEQSYSELGYTYFSPWEE